MQKKNWLNQIDMLLLGAMAVLSIVVSILDFLDLLGKIPWLNLDISKLSLLLLGTVALFLVVERRKFMEDNFTQIHENVAKLLETPETIIKSLNGVNVQTFENPFELLQYTTKRVGDARWIDDTSWGTELGYEAQLPQNQKISAEHRRQMVNFAKKKPYREIFIFNRAYQKDALKDRLENKDIAGYSCAYYENPPEVLLKFMLVDNEEVVLLADNFKGNMAIRHPEIVAMFKTYYQMLVSRAKIIKDANGVHQDVLDRLVTKLREQDPNFQITLP